MSTKEKYIGDAPIKDKPKKALRLKLGDNVVKTQHLSDGSVTLSKLASGVSKGVMQDALRQIYLAIQQGGLIDEIENIDFYHIGDDAPGEGINLWIDPQNDEDLPAADAEEMTSVKAAIAQLQEQMGIVMNVVRYGAIPGSSTRKLIMTSAEPLKPDAAEDDTPDDTTTPTDSGNSGSTDSGTSGDTGNTGDTGDTGNTGDSGSSGDGVGGDKPGPETPWPYIDDEDEDEDEGLFSSPMLFSAGGKEGGEIWDEVDDEDEEGGGGSSSGDDSGSDTGGDTPSGDDTPSEDTEEEDTLRPDGLEFTVTSVCCKLDTATNFAKNKQNLIDGELLFYTDRKMLGIYYNGKFHAVTGSGGGSSSGDGITIEDLYSLQLDHLNFQSVLGTTFKVTVDSDGHVKALPYDANPNQSNSHVKPGNVYVSGRLCINSVYLGGEAENSECLCSHNYIELGNGSQTDINLNGLYLLYTDLTWTSDSHIGYVWKYLALDGIIKAGSTFVIRGARCNSDKRTLITVSNCDMEWYDNGELIRFKQGNALFYLCIGDSFMESMEAGTLSVPYVSSTSGQSPQGYIDSCGFGNDSHGENSAPLVPKNGSTIVTNWNNILFFRTFALEPAKQGNKDYSARKTSDLWSYMYLDRQTERMSISSKYYWDDEQKIKQTPHASYEGKDFFTNKTQFKEHEPNYLNCLFGMQATYKDASHTATRCFNWISVGYYDEYLEYKKTTDTTWTRRYSITPNDPANDSSINAFIDQYQRIRWKAADGHWVTTHKCIIKGLDKGVYEYRVGRDNDVHFASPTLTFEVKSDTDVEGGFSFIQVTDQQAFNFHEYTAWWKTADCIKNTEQNYDFLINTGDITQSGNRPSEWLDYYRGKQALIDKVEMFTVGNNDLCGRDVTVLNDGEDATSKYSHINVLYYFCFELDPRNNSYHYVLWEGVQRPIYSLYSFNYGNVHFVCLNSEIAAASSKMYTTDEVSRPSFAQAANAQIENWLKKDLQLYYGLGENEEPQDCSNTFIYMHEMPFTMVTYSFFNDNNTAGKSADRAGSHLNTLNSNGVYRFSRLFKKYGIRLVFGGHKHTYTISKPIYDAPAGYLEGESDLMDAVSEEYARKPVVQVKDAAPSNDNKFVRYEVVSDFDAPTYVMCQASGYKLVSNKEQPSERFYPIPWLLSYIPQPNNTGSGSQENRAQHYPMYIRYDFDVVNNNFSVSITAKQVTGIWNVNEQNNTASFDMNNQLSVINSNSMTLNKNNGYTDPDTNYYDNAHLEKLTIDL